MKHTQLPPFYTHVIGSLPRPAAVRDLVSHRDAMPAAEFSAAMDDMVRFAIRLQEQAGLDVVSDGEWRRTHYIREFLTRVGGFEPVRKFEHQGEIKYTDVCTGRMQAAAPVFADDAKFLAQSTKRATKYALPSPFLVAVRYWHADYSAEAYPTMQAFMDHLTELLAAEAKAIAAAGVDIIQLDDPALTYFCDERLTSGQEIHDERLRRQWNAAEQAPLAVAAINRIVEGLDVDVHLHCCHSVYKRQSDVVGNYKPILPLLAKLNATQVNLEFAYHGTGAADDLQLLPDHLSAGMGVVDVRSEALQTVEEIEAIAAAGAKMLPPQRIAMNPDCGFAPDAGEPPTIDEAFEKLRRMCEASRNLRKRLG